MSGQRFSTGLPAFLRKLCNDALADGKTVKLDYVIASGVDITIVSPDGKSQKARMDW